MSGPRVFRVADHLRPADGEPIRSVVHETADASVVAWIVKPGQRIIAHVHPHGQDTWTIVAGQGAHQTDASGATVPIAAGDIVIASAGEVHGVQHRHRSAGLRCGRQPRAGGLRAAVTPRLRCR